MNIIPIFTKQKCVLQIGFGVLMKLYETTQLYPGYKTELVSICKLLANAAEDEEEAADQFLQLLK